MFKRSSRILLNGALPYGALLFLLYMLAKAPLLLFGQGGLDTTTLLVALTFVFVFMLCAVTWLLLYKKIYAGFFLLAFNLLFFMALCFGDFNSFGFFKYASLSIFLSSVALGYCMMPRRHSLPEVLLVFAGFLTLYGSVAVVWGVINGVQFSMREATIGINGPIVFGQLMIVASAIFLLYSNRQLVAGSLSAGLSLLSFSKGPVLAGLFILFLKRKMLFILLMMLGVGVVFLLPDSMVDNRFFYFIESVYQSVTNSDADVLMSGSNYGSVGSRLEQYFLAAQLLSDYPLGVGVGLWGEHSSLEYPHNYLVEVLGEQGLLLGSASLLLVCVLSIKAGDKNIKYLIVMFFLFSMFSGSVVDNRGIYFMILLGLLYRGNEN